MTRRVATVVCACAVLAWAPSPAAVDCPCDHAAPATLAARECGLCQVVEQQTAAPGDPFPVFFVKDASPRKPNRTLALPMRHGKGGQDLRQLTPAERAAFWKAAIVKAQGLWPDAWGLAINAASVRTQCHLHIHIGRLNEGVDESSGWTASQPEEFPAPEPGCGVWLHPIAGGFHVHTDRDIAEPVLMR